MLVRRLLTSLSSEQQVISMNKHPPAREEPVSICFRNGIGTEQSAHVPGLAFTHPFFHGPIYIHVGPCFLPRRKGVVNRCMEFEACASQGTWLYIKLLSLLDGQDGLLGFVRTGVITKKHRAFLVPTVALLDVSC